MAENTSVSNMVSSYVNGSSPVVKELTFDYQSRFGEMTDAEKDALRKGVARDLTVEKIHEIHKYGSQLNERISSNADKILSTATSKGGSSEVVDMLNELVLELQNIEGLYKPGDEPSALRKWLKGLPLIGGMVKDYEKNEVTHNTIADNVKRVSTRLTAFQSRADANNNTLADMIEETKNAIEENHELILGAMVAQDDMMKQLTEMQEHRDQYDSLTINDYQDAVMQLDTKIQNMQLTEMIFAQDIENYRQLRNNNLMMINNAEQAQNCLVPIWKKQLSASLIAADQKVGIEVQSMVVAATSETLRKNSKTIRENAVAVAKANAAPIIEIDALRESVTNAIGTLKDLQKVDEESQANKEKVHDTMMELARMWKDAAEDYGDSVINRSRR